MLDKTPFSSFPARFYLEKYYSHVGDENEAFMRAVGGSVQMLEELGTVVELGGGPSLCGMFAMAAATRAGPGRVIWIDIAPSNLAEVNAWLEEGENAFKYTEIFRWIARQFGADHIEIEQRLRRASWDMRVVDLWEGLPVDLLGTGDIVGSYFLAEAATDEEQSFIRMTSRIAEVASTEARVALAYIRRSQPYNLDDGVVYPAFAVDETSLPMLLDSAGLNFAEMHVQRGPLDQPPARSGYDGMVFVLGRLAAN